MHITQLLTGYFHPLVNKTFRRKFCHLSTQNSVRNIRRKAMIEGRSVLELGYIYKETVEVS